MDQKDLFLCHNGADKPWARTLGQRIEAERWNERPLTVFLDEWDINLGDNILLKINEALERSRFVGLLMSPEMMGSEWCKAEFTAVLAADPTNRLGRLIPMRVRDTHKTTGEPLRIPPILAPFNYLDMRESNPKKEFARNFARLLAKLRGEMPPRGSPGGRSPRRREDRTATGALVAMPDERDEPDPVPEALLSNLLPVRALPSTVWSAPTALRAKRDLPPGNHLPPFLLRESRLYSFEDLSERDHPFTSLVVSGGVRREALVEWRATPDRWRWAIELLNGALREHLYCAGVSLDPKQGRFFFRRSGEGSRVLRWGAGDDRTVVRAPDADKSGYWVHQAARLRFETLGSQLYLTVDPCWMFTTDGRKPVPREAVGPLAMQWGGKERNGTILRHVLMWSDLLAQGRKSAVIRCGRQHLEISRLPATVQAPVSLADDRVRGRALLAFTRVEQNLVTDEETTFGYRDGDAQESEDDDGEAA